MYTRFDSCLNINDSDGLQLISPDTPPAEACLNSLGPRELTRSLTLRAPPPLAVVWEEGVPLNIFRDLSRKTPLDHSIPRRHSGPGQLTDWNVVPGRPAVLVLGDCFPPPQNTYAEVKLARRHQRGRDSAMEDEITAWHCMVSV